MKSTGIVRRVDDLGRVVIPKEIRKTHQLGRGTPLELFIGDNGTIVLSKQNLQCALCGAANDTANLQAFKTVVICEACLCELHTTH